MNLKRCFVTSGETNLICQAANFPVRLHRAADKLRSSTVARTRLADRLLILSDSILQQGQGMHGSLGRGDTLNFTAAIGPDFRRRFVDPAPVSNADVGHTMFHLLGLTPPSRGALTGRVFSEATPGHAVPKARAVTLRSKPAANRLRTTLRYQQIGTVRYLDAGGFAGRTLGLDIHVEGAAK